MRILVADKLADEGLEFLKHSGVGYDAKIGLKEDELAAAVGSYDAMVVRSGAKVTARVLENPGQLKAIARAGVETVLFGKRAIAMKLSAATIAGIFPQSIQTKSFAFSFLRYCSVCSL
jgi:phosphoglycerate dehydrogenase-like enzyme